MNVPTFAWNMINMEILDYITMYIRFTPFISNPFGMLTRQND
jgi:hypothetical protein